MADYSSYGSGYGTNYKNYDKHSDKEHSSGILLDESRRPSYGRLPTSTLSQISLEIPYEVISEATENWSDSNKLGIGAFGSVYRGVLEDGNEVAVKLLDMPEQGGFDDEVRVLSRFRHPNLVILMGFSKHPGGTKRILVYELLPGGDVHQRIKWARDFTKEFTGTQRVSVALDAAQGLSHLHYSKPKAFHRDIKAPNIILDRKNTAKLGDFGLACIANSRKDESYHVKNCAGTVGYACPHYIKTGIVSESSEVYSFGMVLLELLTAQPPAIPIPNPIIRTDGKPGAPTTDGTTKPTYRFIANDILDKTTGKLLTEKVMEKLDISARWNLEIARRLSDLAIQCIAQNHETRPKMAYLVIELRKLDDRAAELGDMPKDSTWDYHVSRAQASSSNNYYSSSKDRGYRRDQRDQRNGFSEPHNNDYGYYGGGSENYAYGGSKNHVYGSSFGNSSSSSRNNTKNSRNNPKNSSSKSDTIDYGLAKNYEVAPDRNLYDLNHPNYLSNNWNSSNPDSLLKCLPDGRMVCVGMKVSSKWHRVMFCPGRIGNMNFKGNIVISCDIDYEDGDHEGDVALENIEIFSDQSEEIQELLKEIKEKKEKRREQKEEEEQLEEQLLRLNEGKREEERTHEEEIEKIEKKKPENMFDFFTQNYQNGATSYGSDSYINNTYDSSYATYNSSYTKGGGESSPKPSFDFFSSATAQAENYSTTLYGSSQNSAMNNLAMKSSRDIKDHSYYSRDNVNSISNKSTFSKEAIENIFGKNPTGHSSGSSATFAARKVTSGDSCRAYITLAELVGMNNKSNTSSNVMISYSSNNPRRIQDNPRIQELLNSNPSLLDLVDANLEKFSSRSSANANGTNLYPEILSDEAVELLSYLKKPPINWSARLIQIYDVDHLMKMLIKNDRPSFLMYLSSGEKLKIGRLSQPFSYWDVVVREPALRNTISREHFHIEHIIERQEETTNTTFVAKCTSSNGLLLDGEFLEKNEKRNLRHGAILGFISNVNEEPFLLFRFEIRDELEKANNNSIEIRDDQLSSGNSKLSLPDDNLLLPDNCIVGRWDSSDHGFGMSEIKREALYSFEISGTSIRKNIPSEGRQIYYCIGGCTTIKRLKIGRSFQRRFWERIIDNNNNLNNNLINNLIPEDVFEIISERVDNPDSISAAMGGGIDLLMSPQRWKFSAKILTSLTYNYGVQISKGEIIPIESGMNFAISTTSSSSSNSNSTSCSTKGISFTFMPFVETVSSTSSGIMMGGILSSSGIMGGNSSPRVVPTDFYSTNPKNQNSSSPNTSVFPGGTDDYMTEHMKQPNSPQEKKQLRTDVTIGETQIGLLEYSTFDKPQVNDVVGLVNVDLFTDSKENESKDSEQKNSFEKKIPNPFDINGSASGLESAPENVVEKIAPKVKTPFAGVKVIERGDSNATDLGYDCKYDHYKADPIYLNKFDDSSQTQIELISRPNDEFNANVVVGLRNTGGPLATNLGLNNPRSCMEAAHDVGNMEAAHDVGNKGITSNKGIITTSSSTTTAGMITKSNNTNNTQEDEQKSNKNSDTNSDTIKSPMIPEAEKENFPLNTSPQYQQSENVKEDNHGHNLSSHGHNHQLNVRNEFGCNDNFATGGYDRIGNTSAEIGNEIGNNTIIAENEREFQEGTHSLQEERKTVLEERKTVLEERKTIFGIEEEHFGVHHFYDRQDFGLDESKISEEKYHKDDIKDDYEYDPDRSSEEHVGDDPDRVEEGIEISPLEGKVEISPLEGKENVLIEENYIEEGIENVISFRGVVFSSGFSSGVSGEVSGEMTENTEKSTDRSTESRQALGEVHSSPMQQIQSTNKPPKERPRREHRVPRDLMLSGINPEQEERTRREREENSLFPQTQHTPTDADVKPLPDFNENSFADSFISTISSDNHGGIRLPSGATGHHHLSGLNTFQGSTFQGGSGSNNSSTYTTQGTIQGASGSLGSNTSYSLSNTRTGTSNNNSFIGLQAPNFQEELKFSLNNPSNFTTQPSTLSAPNLNTSSFISNSGGGGGSGSFISNSGGINSSHSLNGPSIRPPIIGFGLNNPTLPFGVLRPPVLPQQTGSQQPNGNITGSITGPFTGYQMQQNGISQGGMLPQNGITGGSPSMRKEVSSFSSTENVDDHFTRSGFNH